MNTKKVIRWELITNIVLLCFAVSLFNLAGYIFAAMLLVMLLYNLRHIRISTPELTLVCFSVFYFVVYSFHFPVGIEQIILYLAGPWGAYLIGKQYVLRSRDSRPLMTLVVVLAAGMCAHGLLNWVAMIRSDLMLTYAYQRLSVDFWRGTVVSVTVTGMFFSFATGLSIGALFTKTKKLTKVIAVVTLVACLAATVFFANRTLLAVAAIMLVLYVVVTLLSSKISKNKKILLLLGMAAVLAALVLAFVFNWFGITDKVMSLKIVQRMGEDEGGRLDVWMLFFKDNAFLKYPAGGGGIARDGGMGYLHNLWLDVYNRTGVLSFVAVVIFTVLMAGRYFAFRSQMLRHERVVECTCITALLIATVMNCMVEPIIEANPYYFLIVLMFLGGMNGQTRRLEEGTL